MTNQKETAGMILLIVGAGQLITLGGPHFTVLASILYIVAGILLLEKKV